MKKSFLVSVLSSVFLLSACQEKENSAVHQKLQETEQTIAQLQQELTKLQQDRSSVRQEQGELKEQTPALNVEIVPLFSKVEYIKRQIQNEEDQAESIYEGGDLYYFVSIAQTGLDWLDNVLIRHTILRDEEKNTHKITGTEKEEAIQLIERSYKGMKENLAEGMSSAVIDSSEMMYDGQRNGIASFTYSWYEYSGGAHGVYSTKYLNIDLSKKALITLDHLIPQANRERVKALLWEAYLQELQEQDLEVFRPKEDFYIVDNFYFSHVGIHFGYPVYALGPFVAGETNLTLSWEKANALIARDYQRLPKDGVGLAPARPEGW